MPMQTDIIQSIKNIVKFAIFSELLNKMTPKKNEKKNITYGNKVKPKTH